MTYDRLLLLLCIQWMSRFFEELLLQLQSFTVVLHRADGCHQIGDQRLGVELTEFSAGNRTISSVVVGKTSIPPDPCVQAVRELLSCLVRAGLILCSVQMDQVG